jgi:hypothetical protein
MFDRRLWLQISFIDCTEVIKVFACQAIHISVAEAKEKKLTEGLDLEEKLVEDEVELVENELCHYQEAVLPYAKRRTRD